MQTASGARLARATPTSSNKGTCSESLVARWCLLSPRDTSPTISTPRMLRNARACDAPMFPQPTTRILNVPLFPSIVYVPPADLPLPPHHRCGVRPGARFGCVTRVRRLLVVGVQKDGKLTRIAQISPDRSASIRQACANRLPEATRTARPQPRTVNRQIVVHTPRFSRRHLRSAFFARKEDSHQPLMNATLRRAKG